MQKFKKLKILLLAFIEVFFFKYLCVNAVLCPIGFFDSNGVCAKCSITCYTCTNATECTTCYNRIINNSTKLCEFCPYGQFYSIQIDMCVDCRGSCREECGYQDMCYKCPAGMMFDLTLFTCVSNCTSTQVYINDPAMRNIPICRDTVFYVNPDSIQPIELGTKKYPYKNLALVTMEILNFISHSNHNVTVYIKENTVLYMTNSRNFYLDFSSLTFTTYSDSAATPARAKFEIVDEKFVYFTQATQFNIISYIDLRLDQALNYSGYTSVETDISAYSAAILMINRCSFTISNIDVHRNVQLNINLDAPFIIAVYEQAHTITIKNMNFHTSGRLFRSYQPVNLYVENVYVDFYGMMGGFSIDADCNYPEASTIGTIYFNNVTAENSQPRITVSKSGLLYYAGPANATIKNTNILIYGSLSNGRSPIELQSSAACFPTDGVQQTITLDNILLTLPSNPDKDRFVEAYIEIQSNYPRKMKINIFNNRMVNIVQNVYQVLSCSFTSITNVFITNTTITDVTTQRGVAVIDTMKSVTLLNSNFYNFSNFGNNLFYFLNVENVIIQSLSMVNINATGEISDHIFLFDIINSGTVSVSSIYVKNVDIGLQAGFYFNGLLSKASYNNLYFEHVYIGNNNRMLSTGEFKTIEINNVTLIDTYDQYDSDINNYMLVLDTINLNNASNSSVKNIYIQTSSVNFFKMKSVVGSTSTPIYMDFQNITYKDCVLNFQESLITFSNIETQEQFYAVFDQVTFSNMNFTSGGYLIYFGQQTLTQTILSNMVFSNIFSGGIHLEAHNANLPFKTNVLVQNGKFENVNVDTNSIFLLNEGANLEIRNSSFNQISCLESGCLVYGSNKNTITSIYDTSFTNITAVKAALFLIEDGGVVRIYRCNMVQNFAITSALIYATNDGYYEIYDSKINQNYAIQNIISEIFSSSYYSIIDNTTIYSNEAVSQETIYSEFTSSCRLLCFVPSTLRTYILANPAIYDYPTAPKLFELIYAKLTVRNKSVISNQVSIAKCFISTLTFERSTFYNLAIREKGMRMSQAIMNITDCTFYNISTSDYSAFIFAGVDSEAYIVNSTYSNCTCPFFSSSTAKVSFDKLTLSSCYTYMECISILNAPSISILDSSITYAISNNSTSPFRILSSNVDLISNLSISNLDQFAIYINYCNITTIDRLHISRTYGIYTKNSNINKIQNSIFENNGKGYSILSQASIKGGALLFTNTNFTIESSLFNNNIAKYGAGIYISCQMNPICVILISNSTFTNNIAQNSGGGFVYDLYRPKLSSLVFSNNSALYGPNIASYPIKIKIGDTSINTVTVDSAVSGQITQVFTFHILDYDDQVITLDSLSKITVRPITASGQIDGKSIGVAKAGVIYMDRVVLISMPGSTNILFSVTPSTIDVGIAKAVYGDTYRLPSIIANFRYCRPGEYSSVHKCLPCSEGSFSLFWNATQCEKCLPNAQCQGDDVVFVSSGYWRKTTNSTMIVECPNKNACEGGYNTTNTYPVNCADGYKGVLCSKCMKVGEFKYEKVSNFQCTKCSAPILIYIRVLGMGTGFVLIILFIIYLKRKEGNERTVLMRIMTNYVQLMTSVLAYNMNLPTTVSDLFTPLKVLGSGTTTVFSFDCLSSNSEFTLFTPSPTIFKMFMTAIAPIVLCVIISIILGMIAFISKSSLIEFKRDLVASNVVILFLILPTLIDTSLAMFQCIEIDAGDFRVNSDLDIVCYSVQHIMWCFVLAVPILILWVFGSQILILLYLIKHRKRLNSTSIKKYLHLIYIGYRDERFYWEFINSLKKFIIISLNVFLSQVSKSYKGMTAITTMLITIRLQMFLKPYKLKVNNEVENSSMVAIGFTLYGGLLFFKGQAEVSFIEAIVFILIIAINSVFIMFWVYLMSKTYEHHEVAKRVVALLKIVLFRGENDTVLSSTTDFGSAQNVEVKKAALMHKKKPKGLRFDNNQILKLDSVREPETSNIFMKQSAKKNKNIIGKNTMKKQKELKEIKQVWNAASKDCIDSKCSSIDRIYVSSKPSKRESKELIIINGFPNDNVKISPIVNRQAHKIHIVKKLEETHSSIIPRYSNQSDLESVPK